MLNVTGPSPLYDDKSSNNVSLENVYKRNTSMFGITGPSLRPSLNKEYPNVSDDNLSFEETMKKKSYEFKVILIGSISVGKTSILSRYITNEFDNNHHCTLKVDYKTKIININNMVKAKLNIWDTCGDEKYKSITRQYYRDAHGILLIYDITKKDTFDSIIEWQKEIRNNAPNDSVLFLVGNKTDLDKERKVTLQEGKNKAEELGMLFTEVSAKSGDNIPILFDKICEVMIETIQNKPELNENKINTKLLDEVNDNNFEENKKKKICC